MTPAFTVCTLVRGRRTHLDHMLRGVAASAHRPVEVIVIGMGESRPPDLRCDLPLRWITVPLAGRDASRLPLARARNTAACHARSDWLVFLDVDCIPGEAALGTLVDHAQARSGVVMGTPLYLPPGARLAERAAARAHPQRPWLDPSDLFPAADFGLFWSLCFCLHRDVFQSVGGFDERYVGYGGEDTDFARAIERRGHRIWLSGARVYHQYHPVHQPPLNAFDDIIRNARTYHRKWGDYPMGRWLEEFAQRGLITLTPDAIAVRRRPTPHEIDATRVDGMVLS